MSRQRTNRQANPMLVDALSSRHKPAEAFRGPSPDALERWSAVPLLFAAAPPVGRVAGQLVFDGWKDGLVALRDTASGHTRCLVLQAGSVTLELVAAKDDQGWMFTARARSEEGVRHGLVLKLGRRRMLADAHGFFQWRSHGVPRALELWSRESRLCFESIPWM